MVNSGLDLRADKIEHDNLNKQVIKYVILVAIIAIIMTFIIPV